MTEWWSYRASDFLMFSPRVYFRQIESYNLSLWPLQPITIVVGLCLVCCVIWGRPNHKRIIAMALAAIWLFVGLAYLWLRLSSINWAATYAAFAFAAQAIMIFGVYIRPIDDRRRLREKMPGLIVAVVAILAYPTLPLLIGQNLGHSQVFGTMPDPTVLATIGLLAATRQRFDCVLFIIPAVWCLVSSVTLFTLHDGSWWAPLALGSLGLVAAITTRRTRP